MVLNKLKYGKPTTSLKGKNIVAPSLIFVTRACHWGAVTNPDRDREGALVRLLLFTICLFLFLVLNCCPIGSFMWQGGFLHPVMSISVFSMVPSPLCINPHIFNAVRLGLPPCRIYFAFSMCQGGFLHPTASIFALSTQLGGETNLSMSISHF